MKLFLKFNVSAHGNTQSVCIYTGESVELLKNKIKKTFIFNYLCIIETHHTLLTCTIN